MPSYEIKCEACGSVDFKLCNYEDRDKDTICDSCGGITKYQLSAESLGCIRITDSKLWEDVDNPGKLTRMTRTRIIQNGKLSECGRVIPSHLHIDNIRARIKAGKVKVDK